MLRMARRAPGGVWFPRPSTVGRATIASDRLVIIERQEMEGERRDEGRGGIPHSNTSPFVPP